MRKIRALYFLFFIFILGLLVISSNVFAKDDDTWNNLLKEHNGLWNQHSSSIDEEWKKQEELDKKAWQKYVKEIESKWNDKVTSTQKDWVDYSSDFDSRSNIDFKKGTVAVEVLVPANKNNILDLGKKKLAKKFEKTFKKTNPENGLSYLSKQIKNTNGQYVTKYNIDEFIKDDMLINVTFDKNPILGKDGNKRYKVKANVCLVPDHLKKRADTYKDTIQTFSTKYNMSPALILAIIHTESYFNPKARSGAGAYGLMQLIPRYGARESYRYLYNKDRVVKPEYLLQPENNILLGATYFYLLQKKYFKKIKNNINKKYLSICAYNWGPTAINRKIVRKYPINTMPNEKVYEILREKSPDETSNYLKKVLNRTKLYSTL